MAAALGFYRMSPQNFGFLASASSSNVILGGDVHEIIKWSWSLENPTVVGVFPKWVAFIQPVQNVVPSCTLVMLVCSRITNL
jgi:hypothetical protein